MKSVRGQLARMLSAAIVFVVLFPAILLTPQSAYAIPTESPDVIASDTTTTVKDAVQKTTYGTVVGAVTTALINIMTYFANNFAHDAAVWVASGGNAEEPLFEARPVEDYFIYAGASVANEVINTLNENNVVDGRLEGFNVCAPPNLGSLRAGIRSTYQREELEVCGSLDSIKSNWNAFFVSTREFIRDDEARNEAILGTLSQTIDPDVNGYSVSLSIFTETLLAADTQANQGFFELLGKEGVWDVTDFITGTTTTPSEFIVNDFENKQNSASNLPLDIASNLMSNSDALVQLGLSATSVFTNTLLSELTQKLAEGLFEPTLLDQNPFDEFGNALSSREAAVEALRSLQTFQPLDATNFNLLSELSSCPSNVRGISRRLYNCVIDTNFATALGRSETGDTITLARAVEEGLINGGWPLIPETNQAKNQDPNCYQYGFCYSNLVKLRKARIIPVGWELAAQLPEAAGGTLTLKEVMDGFNDCDENNQRDPNSNPFCHLIDPNWVLKMPETSCRILAHGQLLEAADIAARQQECVDIQSCIAEGENGECLGGYGYCVREKNVWRFRGDSCPAEAASCTAFTSRIGENENFIATTIDRDGCNEGNAGCQWYETSKDEGTEGDYDWPVIVDLAAAEADVNVHRERVYFDGDVETCGENDAGCTQLIPVSEDLTLNLVANSSFEASENVATFPDAWLSEDYALTSYSTAGALARGGLDAIQPNGGTVYQPGLRLNSGSFYTLSYYARRPAAGTPATSTVTLRLTNPNGVDANLAFTSYDTDNCFVTDSNGNGTVETIGISGAPASDQYERFECLFTMPTFSGNATQGVAFLELNGTAWIDDVQLENTTTPSVWTNDYSTAFTSLEKISLKLPPGYLGCDGSPDQPEECGSYAQACTETDAGCTLYTPTNGDPSVAGVVSELDRCDSICVGYDTYKQESTRYEPEGEFPVFFIPDTAEQCTEQAVGCDEFTNLETEQQEYFTYLRACVTEPQSAGEGAVFYTWEGSDVEGYQLRTWNLIESDISTAATYTYDSGFVESNFGDAPCTNWQAREDGIVCNDIFPSGLPNPDTCDEHSDIFSNPDCREFYDANGNIHYRNWRDTVTVNDACVSYRKTTIAGLGDDTDGNGLDDGQENCEASGGYFNDVAGQCIYYGYSEESDTCSESENGCREYTGGQSGNSRIVLNDNIEAGLTNWDAASAANVTFSNDSIATDGHSIASVGSTAVFTHLYDNGAECTTAGGCTSGTDTLGASCIVAEGDRYCGTLEDELFQGKTYTLTFWAKGNGSIDVGFDFLTSGSSPTIDALFGDNIELEAGWNRYSLGPLNMTASNYPDFGEATTLAFVPQGASEFFIDTVVLREGESNVTVIRDSWVTPAQCDENFEGIVSPQFQLGCQEYIDQTASAHYLRSFSRLCNEDVVGCTAYFDTANSDNVRGEVRKGTCSTIDGLPASTKTSCYLLQTAGAYETNSPYLCEIVANETSCSFDLDFIYPDFEVGAGQVAHISYGPDAEVVAPDRTIYAVYSSEFTCSSFNQGCQEVGLPTLSADQSKVESWESVYLINDPDTYDETLCTEENLFCEAWSASDGAAWYFKHPQGKTCEYKTNITVGGATYDGWFRTGTTDFCYGTGTCSNSAATCSLDSDCATLAEPDAVCNITSGDYVIGGVTSGLWKNGDTDYDGWVGTCASENAGCSEFQDTLDIDDNEFYVKADGESYFFKNNDNLDENTLLSSERCNGQVSQRLGCVLFNDTGNPAKRYSASASLIASRHADELFGTEEYNLVDPINCETGDSTITTPSGAQVDLCTRRCAYRNNRLDSTYNRATDVTSVRDIYTLDGSCYIDSDCQLKESDTGDLVEGTCIENAVDPQGVYPTLAVPRLSNDTNRVLKVNRDRVCSEWIAQTDVRPVWDQSTSTYRSISSGIDLCDSFAGSDTTNCTSIIVDDPAVVLDVDRYTSRDVTWYGEEYSGYAIPGMYPVQHLSQVNIAPQGNKACVNLTTGDVTTEACNVNADCQVGETCQNFEDDYRLAYDAGECSVGFGDSCTVGYCSANGSPCSTNAQCLPDGGSCVTGVCADFGTGELSTTFCDDGTDDILDGSCPSGLVCNTSVATKEGSCYRDRCILSASGEGDGFDIETEETQICRAYPEEDSPFSDEKVTLWTDNEGATTEDPNSVRGFAPYSTISGFEGANFCAPGEDCLCSYKRVSTLGGQTGYLDIDTSTQYITGICVGGKIEGALCLTDANCGINVEPDENFDGQPDDDENDDGSRCEPITKLDSIYGLPGFCLERDSGINLQGDQDTGACITWLPIDELQGTTDLYAKFKNAGYFEDTYVCTEVKPFVNLRISDAEEHNDTTANGIACAENDGSSVGDCTDGNSYAKLVGNDGYEAAYKRAKCPDGYFAVVGQCTRSASNTSAYADQCAHGDQNDSPYICVPENSYHVEDPDANPCLPPASDVVIHDAVSGNGQVNGNGMTGGGTSNFGNSSYYWAADSGSIPTDANEDAFISAFNSVVNAYKDCVLPGVEYDTVAASDVFTVSPAIEPSGACADNDSRSGSDGWRCLYMNYEVYPGCSEVAKVVDADSGEGYVFTDKVKLGSAGINTTPSELAYQNVTDPEPFGATAITPEDASTSSPPEPLRIGACTDAEHEESLDYNPWQPSENWFSPPKGITSCTGTTSEDSLTGFDSGNSYVAFSPTSLYFGSERHNPASPEARTYIDFVWQGANYVAGITSPVHTWDVSEGKIDIWQRLNDVYARFDLRSVAQDLFIWEDGEWDGNGELEYSTADFDGEYIVNANDPASQVDIRGVAGIAPTIRGIDPNNCYGRLCEEGPEDTITVNGTNNGDHESQAGFIRITAEFFAYAYKEQLPIRRLIIDWQDGVAPSGSTADDNFYKNHRGLVQGSKTESMCGQGNEWGKTADSCDENHFSYTHNYTCSVNQAEASLPVCLEDGSGKLTNSPCRREINGVGACVFQPRVHVLDNWGWCTGTCTGGNADTGCFEGEKSALTDSGGGGFPDPSLECDYINYPEFGNINDPWTYYDGQIIVFP